MQEPLRYLLGDLRNISLPIAERERTRRELLTGQPETPRILEGVFHTQQPASDTQRPYGYFDGPPSEFLAPINGQTAASFVIHFWGDALSIDEFVEATVALDHHRIWTYQGARDIHYRIESSPVTPDPDLEGVYHLAHQVTALYFIPARIGRSWP